MLALCVPYKPWKFGEGLSTSFFHLPIWKYGTPVWAIRVNILETESTPDTPRTKNFKKDINRTMWLLTDKTASWRTVFWSWVRFVWIHWWSQPLNTDTIQIRGSQWKISSLSYSGKTVQRVPLRALKARNGTRCTVFPEYDNQMCLYGNRIFAPGQSKFLPRFTKKPQTIAPSPDK